ncbi:hypothetical protein ACHAWF_001226, partial [Thalassiosira exigua]
EEDGAWGAYDGRRSLKGAAEGAAEEGAAEGEGGREASGLRARRIKEREEARNEERRLAREQGEGEGKIAHRGFRAEGEEAAEADGGEARELGGAEGGPVAAAAEAGELADAAAAVAAEVVPEGGGAYPWARSNLLPLSSTPDPSSETVLFWHVPKSGGSTAKAIYRCLGQTIDVESKANDISLASDVGLVASGKVDMIFSSFPDLAVEKLFDDDEHRGRALGMFRRPVDRLFSKFFYLQVATWERTYRPEWKDMDPLIWVKMHNRDNDHMVKKLAGKIQRDKATREDLEKAKATVREYFVVGLMSEMQESVRRFDVVMGIDGEDERNRGCLDQYFKKGKKTNSNPHPEIREDHPAYRLLAEQNELDIEFYEYVVQLFEEQKATIDAHAKEVPLKPSRGRVLVALENQEGVEGDHRRAYRQMPASSFLEEDPHRRLAGLGLEGALPFEVAEAIEEGRQIPSSFRLGG